MGSFSLNANKRCGIGYAGSHHQTGYSVPVPGFNSGIEVRSNRHSLVSKQLTQYTKPCIWKIKHLPEYRYITDQLR
jgi:hypothetical protein